MQQETDTQPDSGRAFPRDAVSSSNMTNFGAQHRPRSPRSPVQHRQHVPYIPGRKPSTQKLRRVPENSSLGTDTRVDRPLAADQQRFTGTLEPFPLTTSNAAPSTQLITSILIPDLTSLITRCSPDPIAGGTYGNIYKCIYHGPEGDADVAVKAIRQQFFSAEIFRRELGIWKRLRHSNILKFMGTTSDFGPSVALVAPWMTNGTLTSFLDQNNETLELHDRLLLLRDIAAGLNYLHTFSLTEGGHTDLNPIVHGDLTGTNVLIDNDRKAYLADFGLSGTFKKSTGMTYLAKMTCHPGAVRWAAPELLSGEEPASAATTQSDMYSFGNIMLQVLTGNVPWCHLTRDLQIMYQVAIEGKIHPRPHDVYVTDRHWNFMTCCWSMPFTDRPPAKDAVQFVNSALHLSTSPQSPTSSISSDERHPGIARNDYLQGDADARLPVMQVIDSPLDARENDPRVQWKGSFTFTIQHAGQPKGFEVQVAAVNSKGQLHTETWPDRMILDISQKGLKDPSELKLWLQKHRQSVVMVQFEPQARDSEQKMNDMVYVIIMTKMETRTFGIAAWQLPSGPISYNMIVFPMNNVLVGAVFPVTGLPDLPGSSKVDAPKPQPQPQPHPQGVFTPEMLAQLQNLDPQQLKHFMQQLALQQQMRQRQRQMQQRQQQLQTGAMQQEVQAPAPGVGTQNMSLFWNGAIYR